METISSSVLIYCPAQKVFDYISNPIYSTRYIGYLKMNTNIKPAQPCLGQTFHWQYNVFGKRIEGDAKTIEYKPPEKFVITTSGDSVGIWTYTIEKMPKGVKLTLTIEYEYPSKLIERFAYKLNQNILPTTLENLKVQLESNLPW